MKLATQCIVSIFPCLATLACLPNAGADEVLVKTNAKRSLPAQVTFNAHIRPLMSNTCFACHGPDDEHNESGFHIETFETATATLPSDDELVGIKPGKPEESEVYLRLIGEGGREQMPPEEFAHQLTDYDKALFRKWIEQGAQYEQHWSYAPIHRAPIPELAKHADHVRNPIDAFILHRLEAEGLDPSPAADKATLLRRLSLDLIGLPPTPEQLQSFLADGSDDAYDRQVERLLQSPHFGERMASSWLDSVRFADTVGFHGDQNQRIFPYRDYVIAAFNDNKPFDEFTREQIAGDLLPHPTPEQLTATGVLRLNMVTREGGAQPGEYLAKYRADRVRMLGTAWLGSTLACCECHNHKYDPFTAKDFYSFGAFFDGLRQWGVYSDYRYTPNKDLQGFNNEYPFPPETRVDSTSAKNEIARLTRERDEKLFRELSKNVLASGELTSWAWSLRRQLDRWTDGWIPLSLESISTSESTKHQQFEDGSLLLVGDAVKNEVVTIETSVPETVSVNSVRVEVIPDAHHGGRVGRGEDGGFELSMEVRHDSGDSPRYVANRPRYIRVELPGNNKILSLAEVEVFTRTPEDELTNVATGGTATQSSNYKSGLATLAIDGETNGHYYESKSVTHTQSSSDPWWELDLGSAKQIENVVIWSRTDGDYLHRLDGFRIVMLDDERTPLYSSYPKTPKPSVEVKVPSEFESPTFQPIPIAWEEADRCNPRSYNSGREPRFLELPWRSGPLRWQVPDDETKRPHTAVFHFARPLKIEPGHKINVRLRSGNVGRLRLSVTPIGHAIAGWPAADAALTESLKRDTSQLSSEQKQTLIAAYHRSAVPVKDQHAISLYYRDQILALRSGLAMTLIAQSMPEDLIPTGRVLPRGNWQDESGELSPPGFPHFLPSPPNEKDEPRERLTRLDLANWLTSPENPLTPRHFVNRTWKHFFGTGLSAQLDDLGNQGEWPSHPQLLDRLASDFVDGGWNVKELIRLMVSSNTYRQAAAVRSDLHEIDPYNRLLSQQSARRLEAEIVRDNALAIAGLLVTDYVGGPSVFPYQPQGYYGNLQFPDRKYVASDDFRQYRRGVYMHWQRTFLHPMLVNFDAPSRDECAADRPLSNSPQQALTLLNDPTFVEASHVMAARLLSEHRDESFANVLAIAFVRAVAREPKPQERASLETLYDQQRNYYSNHVDEARKFLTIGNRQSFTSQTSENDLVELAAWSQVCRVILNLHETITRY